MNYRNRRSIRLQGYDYSQAGAYYVTICTQDRLCLFGVVKDGEMVLNDAGKMIETEWLKLKNRFPNIDLHEYVVMPNHFHGVLEIVTVGVPLVGTLYNDGQPCDTGQLRDMGQPHDTGQPQGIAPTMDTQNDVPVGTQNKTVGDMMDSFKSITTVEYIRGVKNMQWQPFNRKLWQRNYYEHIVRDDNDYDRIVNYIRNNPMNWKGDDLHP